MKYIWLILLTFVSSHKTYSQDVQVSEVMYNPSNSNNQWIELHNHGGISLNLSGHYILTTTNTVETPIFLNQLIIPPNSFALVFNPLNTRAAEFTDLNNLNNVTINYTWSNNLPTSDFNCFVSTGTRYKDRIASSRANVKITSGGNGNNFSVEIPESEYPLSGVANKFNQSLNIGGTPGGPYRTFTCWGNTCNSSLTAPNNSLMSLEIVNGSKTFSGLNITTNNIVVRNGATLNLNNSSSRSCSINGSIINNGVFNVQSDYSIVQTSNIANTGNGTSTYSRTISTSPGIFQLWSSPVNNANLQNVFGQDNIINYCDIFTLEVSTQAYKYDWPLNSTFTCNDFQNNISNNVTFSNQYSIQGADGFFDLARGYYAPGRNSGGSYTYSFSSNRFNTGTVSFSLAGANDGDWALIGNPYPGGVSASDFVSNNTSSIYAALYFWEQSVNWDASNLSDYKIWTNLGGVGSSGNFGQIVSGLNGQSIPSTQGFFVEIRNSGVPPIEFTNSMRTASMNAFYKNSETDKLPKAWLHLEKDRIGDNILVGIADDALLERDDYDARKLFPMKPPMEEMSNFELNQNWDRIFFYTKEINPNMKYIVQAIPTYDAANGYMMPLGFHTNQKGVHTIVVDSTYIIKNNDIILIDHERNIEHKLNKPYSFEVNEIGENESRFSLRFDVNPFVTGVENPFTNDNVEIYQSFDDIVLRAIGTNMLNVTVTDLAGRQVYHRAINNRNEIRISKESFDNGMMIVTLSLEDGNRISKKLFIR